MSKARRNPRKARQRRDRIRRGKHVRTAGVSPAPATGHIPEFLPGEEPKDRSKLIAEEIAGYAVEADGLEEALYWIRTALDVDPDCTDAQRHKVRLLPMGRQNGIRLMRGVVDRAAALLGGEFFEENEGRVWDHRAGRPYLRAMRYLAELLAEAGWLEEAVEICRRMLELDIADRHGMVVQLLAIHLAAHQLEDAAGLLSQDPDDEKPPGWFNWARAQQHWLAGDFDGAATAVRKARLINPLIEPYITGAPEDSGSEPLHYGDDDEAEAEICAAKMGVAWVHHPEFRKWVHSVG